MTKVWLRLLVFTLMGYTCIGRGFAHIGIPPLYIGEFVLFVGVCVALCARGFRFPVREPILWLWVAFACWGAIRMIPFLSKFGVDALRDAVTWGYGVFAVLVSGFLLTTRKSTLVIHKYMQWAQWFLIIVPVPLLLYYVVGVFVPTPLSPSVSLTQVRRGDTAVHLAGVLAFALTGLAAAERPARNRFRMFKKGLAAVGFVIALVVVVCASRAALLVVFAAMSIVVILQPKKELFGRSTASLFIALPFVVALALLFIIANPTLPMPRITPNSPGQSTGRQISPEQIIHNVKTLFTDDAKGDAKERDLSESREWRLQWWDTIIQYTIHGPYFWQGKGFGVNLADDDGFTAGVDDENRSPHNSFLCILARSGVVGLALWIALQGAFLLAVLRAYVVARRFRATWWISVNVWLLAYWSAFIVNGIFDVYLESPQGGIPFWSFFGVGIALVSTQRHAETVVESSSAVKRIHSYTGPSN